MISTLFITANNSLPINEDQRLFAGGTSHSLVLIGNDLWAFGEGTNGQLGNGTTENSLVPISIGDYDTWQSVTSGNLFSIGLKTDGTLWGWGRNNFGQLGLGVESQEIFDSPVQIGTNSDWISVSAGSFHVLALRADGTIWSWGRNNWGQIGDGTSGTLVPEPQQIGTDSEWTQIVAGGDSSFAIRDDGSLWSWGSNQFGQRGRIGNGWLPGLIGTNEVWETVTAGNTHVSAIQDDGSLWSWGSNTFGELGNGTNINQSFPELINYDNDWQYVTAGTDFTIALKTDGTLWGWGRNNFGQLGNGTFTDSNVPVAITGDDWQYVAAGHGHVMALKANGSVWTFGLNHNGQLGNDSTINSYLPIMIFDTPSYQITRNPILNTIFPSATVGYTTQEANTFTITNSGNQVTGTLTITISSNSFIASTNTLTSINPSAYETFNVRPADGLAVGTYEATITVAGRNGIEALFSVSFTVNPLREVTINYGSGSGLYTPGDLVTITAGSPASGYRFSNWQVIQGAVTLTDPLATTTTFTMPETDLIITAIFERIISTITVQSTGNGTVSADSSSAFYGSLVTLSTTPDYGFRFKEWRVLSGEITITDNQFVMPGTDIVIEAIFEAIIHTITINYDNGLASSDLNQASYQTLITLSYTANFGFRFKEWLVLEGNVTITDNQFIMPNENVVIKALFEAITFSVIVNSDGNGTVATDLSQAEADTIITLSATPNAGYRLKEWQIIEGVVTINSYNQFMMPQSNVIVRAVFERIPFSIRTLNDGNGTLIANLSNATFGTNIILTVAPNDGYRFLRFEIIEGNITISNDRFVMPTENVAVRAIFEAYPTSFPWRNLGIAVGLTFLGAIAAFIVIRELRKRKTN